MLLVFFSDQGGPSLKLGDDDAGDKVSEDLPDAVVATEEVERVRSSFTVRFDRQNITNTRSWSVDRDHGTLKAADAFICDHPQAVLRLGTGYLQRSGKGLETRYFLNAVVTAKCVRHDGQSTVFSYSLRCGEVTAKKP